MQSSNLMDAMEKEQDIADQAVDVAALLLNEARRMETKKEEEFQEELAGMMQTSTGKVFITSLADQCFRSSNKERIADQMVYLIKRYGIPEYLSFGKRTALCLFKACGKSMPQFFVPLLQKMIRKQVKDVILPEELLSEHLIQRKKEGIEVNLNHLGEAVHGEEEALLRLNMYLEDLKNPLITCISVKVSTLYSQINLLAWDHTLEVLAARLKLLYTESAKNGKCVNLDMEEFRDVRLTLELFKKVLSEPGFENVFAGIVLQAYLPSAFSMQEELTTFARQRVEKGGAPIKIRLVKGANLAMERLESELKGWPLAPFNTKEEVDANFKRMMVFGCKKENAKVAHIGIGSHNLFDIAYGLILRSKNNVQEFVVFEMLEGMAPACSRSIKEAGQALLMYCPVVDRQNFENAIAYLMRRFDENTAPENFLRSIFGLKVGSISWENQREKFMQSCALMNSLKPESLRLQNRILEPLRPEASCFFRNEPDTDWSLIENQKWADSIVKAWLNKEIKPILSEKNAVADQSGKDPSNFGKVLYHYSNGTEEGLEEVLVKAKKQENIWAKISLYDRSEVLEEAAHIFRQRRGNLIGAMIAEGGKTIPEADVEISEAIDFIDYYRRGVIELSAIDGVKWKPKGLIFVASPWNFPCSIPTGGIAAALATGNTVLFKPAKEATLIGFLIAQIFWEAGVPKDVLHFFPCDEQALGTKIIQDPRVNAIILTGETETAKHFLTLRPGVDLMAETGGKNSIIVTSLADRDLAISSIIQSAFSHAGQKCSACSLAILEEEVYHCPKFRRQLRDAAASLSVGSAWDPATKVTPLVNLPSEKLLRGLTQLEEGEEWLLQPVQDAHNPQLWSPGIKLGVRVGTATQQTELFGPVLGLICAKNLSDAIEIANSTRYGLTAGIQTLDDREKNRWLQEIEAGNCYVNRSITGAIVQRQSFGGCKESSFGPGAKAGGPNYIIQLMQREGIALPKKKESIQMDHLRALVEDKFLWDASLGSYAYHWKHNFSKDHDPSQIKGQDNILRYLPQKKMAFRVQENDILIDILRIIAAASICGLKLQISSEKEISGIKSIIESEETFVQRIRNGEVKRVRVVGEPSEALKMAPCTILKGSVLAHGRLELLHYLREVSLSIDYHRYGNLGEREKEIV